MKRNPIVFVAFLVLAFLAAGYISYVFFLPLYIEKKIFPSLGEQLDISLTGQVFSIGLNDASIGDLIIGDTDNAAVSISSIHTSYSISSIIDKKISQVRINGLVLNMGISEDGIVIPGLDLEKFTGPKTKNKSIQPASAISLPLQLDNLQINNGLLNILYEGQRLHIPFDLKITRKDQSNNNTLPAYQLNLRISPQGEEIAISGLIDLQNNKGTFSVYANSFDMQPFEFLLGELHEILSFGKASITGKTEINLKPFQLISSEIDCELESVAHKKNPVVFAPPKEAVKANNAVQLKITGNELQWDIAVQGFMVAPLSASISLDGSFVPGEDNAAKGFGSFLIKIDEQTITPGPSNSPVMIEGNPELRGDVSVDIMPTGAWQVQIESPVRKEFLVISYGRNSLKANIPSFNIQGEGSGDDARMLISMEIADVHSTDTDVKEVRLAKALLQASFNQENKSGTETLSSGEFTLLIPDIKIKRDAFAGKGNISLTGEMKPQQLQEIKSLQAAGELVVNNAETDELENNVSIHSLEGSIPWQWPRSGQERTGKFKISKLKWGKNEIGSFDADIKLKDSAYSLDGAFTHTLLNGLVTNIKGQARITAPEYQSNILINMDATPFSSLQLGEFSPSLSGSYINGELGLDGKLMLDANGLKGNMTVMMQNGRFEYPDKNYTIDNINFSFLMPSLPDLHSAPAQEIIFDEASVGNLVFKQGKVVWQLESPDSIFIEKGVFSWAGGRVFTNAIRISPAKKEFVVPIFCDRLKLTELLNQFGVTGAEGEGTVSGRIPLLVGKDSIRFEDGFLFSSPGQGGSVKVAAFDVLAAGIPKNTPQFAQVDFAAEALKNFQYNWVKLLLNSEGEELIMQMHMDGKPVQLLPFSYDTQTGLLQRVDDNSQGINQPIRLNVNFRLPLNRFIGYSGKIQDIMKKIQ